MNQQRDSLPGDSRQGADNTLCALTDMLSTALTYAEWGWPVFPCWWTPEPGVCACPLGAAETKPKGDKHTKGKHPATRHGFKDATTDVDVITQWWTRAPYANVGLATGLPAPDAVDIDTKDGREGMASRDRLARAGLLRGAFAEVQTPSGGLHYYYAGTRQTSAARPKHGVDFRSAGGYVVAPGSRVDGRRYVVLDSRPRESATTVDWSAIVAFLDPPKPPTVPVGTPFPRHSSGALARWAERKLADQITLPVGPDRSADFFELARLCRLAGMTEMEAESTLTPWCDSAGKYVGRVDREIARVWRKVEVPA